MDYLTRQQLRRLTGYTQRKRQIEWLEKNGIKHFIRADGELRVLPCFVGTMCRSCRPSAGIDR